jgi:hypothetical protein
MTIAVLIITIFALLFALAAIVFFKAESSNGGNSFCNPRLVLHAGGREGFSISQNGLFANDDASNHGIECAGEGRRLAARSFFRWINIRGAGRGCFD